MTQTTASQLQVRDVMSTNPVCVGVTTSAHELAEVLEGNGISGVPVIDTQGRIVGVVSRTDLIHRCLDGPVGGGSFFAALANGLAAGTDFDPESIGNVEEFMSGDPVTATVDEPIGAVARRMAEQRVHRVVVIDDDRQPIGMVTTLDLLERVP
jgi:CBS domain-containing protein